MMFISTSPQVGKKVKQTEKLTAKGMGSWKGSVVKRRSSYVVVQLKKKYLEYFCLYNQNKEDFRLERETKKAMHPLNKYMTHIAKK